MEQSHGEANSRSAIQEFHYILWNPKVNYLDSQQPPVDPVLSQMTQSKPSLSSFLKTYFNINILPSTPRP
jgi:hypothetical protein